MANGDLAAAAGMGIVSAGGDIKQGFDNINYAQDQIAYAQGIKAWALSPITPAPNWGTLTDPNGSTTSLQGGIKLLSLAALLWYASFRMTWTGGTITPTGPNITDLACFTLSGSYRPAAPRYLRAHTGSWEGSVRVNPDGTALLTNFDSGASMPSGTVVQFEGYALN